MLCGLGLVVDGLRCGELGWGEVAVGGVGPLPVVVDAPVLDDHARLAEAVEVPIVVDWFAHRRLFHELGQIPPAELEDLHYSQFIPAERQGLTPTSPHETR